MGAPSGYEERLAAVSQIQTLTVQIDVAELHNGFGLLTLAEGVLQV